MSIQLIATCLAVTLALLKFEAAHRLRNCLIAGIAGGIGALVENGLAGDWLRAAFFAPGCFFIAACAVWVGYAVRRRRDV